MGIEPTRPALRYHGGKWMLAPWIIEHFGPHRVYIEPFGGAASVLLRKWRSYAEIYNDLDGEIVEFFRLLQDTEQAGELIHLLQITPFARAEFDKAYEPTDCPIERARRLCIRSFMGFGSDGHNDARKTGFRANSDRSGNTPAHDWMNYPNGLQRVVERLRGVIIENRPAIDVISQHDCADALIFADPPYLSDTRAPARSGARKNYRHEMSDEEHLVLLEALAAVEGAVVLSGYPHALYDDNLPGWERIERAALADGARPRTECLWINPRGQQWLNNKGLFE